MRSPGACGPPDIGGRGSGGARYAHVSGAGAASLARRRRGLPLLGKERRAMSLLHRKLIPSVIETREHSMAQGTQPGNPTSGAGGVRPAGLRSPKPEAASTWRAEAEAVASELHGASTAAAYDISRDQLAGILNDVANKYLPARASNAEARQMLTSLRLDELLLARACAAGHERAWEVFLTRFREKLYGAAY